MYFTSYFYFSFSGWLKLKKFQVTRHCFKISQPAMHQSYALLEFSIYYLFLELELCTMNIFSFKIYLKNPKCGFLTLISQSKCIIRYKYSWIVQTALLLDKC